MGILGAGRGGLGSLRAPSARHKGWTSDPGLVWIRPDVSSSSSCSMARAQPKFRWEFNPSGNGARGFKALPGSPDTRPLLLGKGSNPESASLQPSAHSGSPGKAIPAHLGGSPETEGAGRGLCVTAVPVAAPPCTSRASHCRELGISFRGAEEFGELRLWTQEESWSRNFQPTGKDSSRSHF